MASNHDECVRPDIPLMEFVREFLLYDRKKARLARLQYCIITPIFMHAHCMMVCDVGLRINLVLFCQEDSLAIRRISFSCSEKRQCTTLGADAYSNQFSIVSWSRFGVQVCDDVRLTALVWTLLCAYQRNTEGCL